MSAARCFLFSVLCLPLTCAEDDVAVSHSAILSTLQRQADAWNAGDIPEFMDGYVKSEQLRFASGGSIRRGWQTTLERFQSRYDTAARMGTLRFSDFEVTQISDDYAEVFGTFHLTRDESIGNASGLFTLLMQRVDGRWLILHDHTSSADPTEEDQEPRTTPHHGMPPDVQAVLDTTDAELTKLASRLDADETPPDTLSTLSQQGDLACFQGDFPRAVEKYTAMLPLDPGLRTSHWRLGIALYYAGQPEAGAAVFDRYHSFDNVDRENGIWRFLCHYRAFGEQQAREQLLRYDKDDRHPFPRVYRMFAGTLSADELVSGTPENLAPADRNARLFYCHLYAGLYLAVQDQPEAAKRHLEQAILNSWPRTAGFGPKYMWHVGRLQYLQLARD